MISLGKLSGRSWIDSTCEWTLWVACKETFGWYRKISVRVHQQLATTIVKIIQYELINIYYRTKNFRNKMHYFISITTNKYPKYVSTHMRRTNLPFYN